MNSCSDKFHYYCLKESSLCLLVGEMGSAYSNNDEIYVTYTQDFLAGGYFRQMDYNNTMQTVYYGVVFSTQVTVLIGSTVYDCIVIKNAADKHIWKFVAL